MFPSKRRCMAVLVAAGLIVAGAAAAMAQDATASSAGDTTAPTQDAKSPPPDRPKAQQPTPVPNVASGFDRADTPQHSSRHHGSGHEGHY